MESLKLKSFRHIVFTGPESSGKTTLAEAFSVKKDAVLTEEYAREYLESKTSYKQGDLTKIAIKQQQLIENALKASSELVVSDTDLLTIKIWSEYKYGHCDSWITSTLAKNLPDLYVLCKPDFPWQDDPLRENPDDRDELYQIYLNEIKAWQVPFLEVGGSVEERIEQVLEVLK